MDQPLVLFLALVSFLAVLSACGTTVAPTPATPQQPATPSAPTAAPQPTATLAPGVSTPVPLTPTPTRIIPTPTPVATGQPVYGGTIRFAHPMHIDTLDPVFNTLGGSYSIFYAVYNGLFRIDPSANVLPALAKSWEFSPDGRVITLHLQTGVKFHDGAPFNAQAVKWNFDRMMDPQQSSPRTGELKPYIKQVAVVNDETVRLELFEPFRPFLPILASDRPGFLVSPAAVNKFGGGRDGNYGRNPVGTGSFRFVEWKLEDHVLLRRNDSYWEPGKPYLDAIYI